MNGPNDTLPEGSPPAEDLLAYLDGELEPAARDRIEQMLSSSGELRQRLKEFQQTWDLLDDLPRSEVQDSFTRTTVEMVAIRAQDAVEAKHRITYRRKFLLWSVGILSIVGAGVIGFAVGSYVYSRPNEQLVKDLPVLEHFDAYRNAGSLEFLQKLDGEKLFQEEGVDAI